MQAPNNYLGYFNTAITVIVLVVTIAISYEKQNTVSSTDIALIKQKVETIEANIIELKLLVNEHVENSNHTHAEINDRLYRIEAQIISRDNTRVAYSYLNK